MIPSDEHKCTHSVDVGLFNDILICLKCRKSLVNVEGWQAERALRSAYRAGQESKTDEIKNLKADCVALEGNWDAQQDALRAIAALCGEDLDGYDESCYAKAVSKHLEVRYRAGQIEALKLLNRLAEWLSPDVVAAGPIILSANAMNAIRLILRNEIARLEALDK